MLFCSVWEVDKEKRLKDLIFLSRVFVIYISDPLKESVLEHARKEKILPEKMKKEKLNNNSNQDVNNCKVVKKKNERHIVSWSQEEDDILREQIQLHGSENWTIIASKFKDKTTRQCRRRWFTYLNSDFKKGGWSPEEDILLCEAQRKYGNRWTEIAKVVSGRTDNAVKNRFTTLCKKKAKHAVNSTTSYFNLNNKRVTFRDEGSENATPKKIRACVSSITVHHKHEKESAVECGAADNLLVHPSAGIGREVESCEALVDKSTENRSLHMLLSKDDPKLLALTQQAQLLSCLANKVNTDTTDQSLENAWMKKECRMLKATEGDSDFQRDKLKELEEDLRSCDEGSRSSLREVHMCEPSPVSSENSTRSTLLSNVACDKTEECDAETACETGHILQEENLHQHCVSERNVVHHEVKIMPTYEEVEADNGSERDYPNTEFSSPTHVTPLFTTLAAAVPTPKFSESEKHFLMKTLGLESRSPSPIKNPSQPPPCKRSLLHCL